VNQPEPERPAVASNKESAPPPKPAENPDAFKGTVSVTFSPYPSIRIPAELRSQMAKQGASLQIGQLVTRVDPVYPEDAEKRHVEGTVKLRVIIGRDGAVESVGLISGPDPLVPAATSAARQWRYKPASVGGQPVEAEQDITMAFRLVKQAAQPK
jgi:TonB family protein